MMSPEDIAKEAAQKAFDLAKPPGGSPRLAARLLDNHICPMVDGVKPHVGGPILPPCAINVLIGFQPAARVGDMLTCIGPPDTIATGSPTVLINNKMAARLMDTTAHGGIIITGFPTVMIGP